MAEARILGRKRFSFIFSGISEISTTQKRAFNSKKSGDLVFTHFGGPTADTPSFEEARIVVLPLCYEQAPSYGTGSREGPFHILWASEQTESMDEETLEEVGIKTPLDQQVVRLATLARKAGVSGVVASPREINLIRDHCGSNFLIVTPGVRPAPAAKDDQKRTLTPGEAVRAGANYIVVGRPIREADDPVRAADAIAEEIS